MQQSHVENILNNYPLGIQIKFEMELRKLQVDGDALIVPDQHINKPLLPVTNKQIKIQVVQLHKILEDSTDGKLVLTYFKTHSNLNDAIRGKLVDLIIQAMISNKIAMSIKLADSISDQIVSIFSSEIKDTYFMRHGPTNIPRGKLYAIIKKCDKPKRSQTVTSRNNIFTPEIDISDTLDLIKYGNSTFPELKEQWKATLQYRLQKIKDSVSTADILKEWKSYTVPLGYKLVDIDFDELFKEKNNFITEFEKYSDALFQIIDKNIKERDGKLLIESLKNKPNDISQNGRNTALFHFLSTLFVPTSRKVTRDENGEKKLLNTRLKIPKTLLSPFIRQ